MGYTHYWRFYKNQLKQMDFEDFRNAFKTVAEEIKLLYGSLPRYSESAGEYYKDVPLEIRGGFGVGNPIINETTIWFNGDEKDGMSHETFSIDWSWDDKEGEPFDFCKTARKPYDLLVCVALISFVRHFTRNNIRVSSDGDMADWRPAIEFYHEIFDFDATKIVDAIIDGD
jgi:hypothetical protein